jgi:NADH-quinone oxidoreductase subunit N
MLGCLALLLLVLEIVLPKPPRRIPDLASAGQLGTLSACFSTGRRRRSARHLQRPAAPQRDGQFLRAFFLLSGASSSACSAGGAREAADAADRVLPHRARRHGAMMLLAQSNHFVMLFVALETLTIGFYILVSYHRTNPLSLEAGLKYLLMGALSSGLLLFGIVLLYGVAGNPALPAHTAQAMNLRGARASSPPIPDNFVASLGIVLVLAGVAFKIGAFPFQIWVPDVYQGAPTPVTAFLAVASKAAGFAVLLVLRPRGFSPYHCLVTVPVLTAMAAATISSATSPRSPSTM